MAMNFDEMKGKALLEEAQRWAASQGRAPKAASELIKPRSTIDELRAMAANWPDNGPIPFEKTPEGERLARFRKMMEDTSEFLQNIDRKQLRSPVAFDRVAQWDGRFPGPLGVGATGTAKTRAAFSALDRLYVKENRSFAWFPVKRLIAEMARYEKKDLQDEFWRKYRMFDALFVDDVDKINWQFESEIGLLFQFYDWVYRAKRPCITTTNKSREWWRERTGDALVRRLFVECHVEVNF